MSLKKRFSLFAKLAFVFFLFLAPAAADAQHVFRGLPKHPGYYTFRLFAAEGYSWNGKQSIVVGPIYFRSQEEAWSRIQRVPHVSGANLKSFNGKRMTDEPLNLPSSGDGTFRYTSKNQRYVK